MTEKQLEMVKRLSDKYEISKESIDKTLLLIGLGYGLKEEQIEEYLVMGEGKLMEKHMRLLCLALNIEKSDMDVDIDCDAVSDSGDSHYIECLEQLMKNHYTLIKEGKRPYEKLAKYILSSTDLSAAQIEQLRLSAGAGMPEEDVLMLARTGKEPMEIRRCVEFIEMVKKVKKK